MALIADDVSSTRFLASSIDNVMLRIIILNLFPQRFPSVTSLLDLPTTASSTSFNLIFSSADSSISYILIFCVVLAFLSFVPAQLIRC